VKLKVSRYYVKSAMIRRLRMKEMKQEAEKAKDEWLDYGDDEINHDAAIVADLLELRILSEHDLYEFFEGVPEEAKEEVHKRALMIVNSRGIRPGEYEGVVH
jgi:hypothetical protein